MSGAQSAKRAAAGAEEQVDQPADDGFTDEERQQFEAMQQADTRVVEGDEKPAVDAEKKPAEGEQQPEKVEQKADADEDDEGDDDGEQRASGEAKPGEAKQPPRRVNYKKFERMETRAKKAEEELNQTRENLARMDERIKLINEALTPKQQEEAKSDEDPEPDPEKDIFGYVRWQGRQIARLTDVIKEGREERQTEQAEQGVVTSYVNDVRNFAAQEPNFGPAYQFLMKSRIHELGLYHYDKDLRQEGVTLTPQEYARIKKDIEEEERQLAREAISQNQSPAKRIYGLARARGYEPPAAKKPDEAGKAATDAEKTNGKGGAPGSLAAAAGKVSVTDEIANIKRGKASPSLSEGGGAPSNPLTPERLASMSQDEFNDFMDGLSPAEQRRVMGG